MSKISIPGAPMTPHDAPSTPPTGNVGINMSGLADSLRPTLYLVTIVVSGGASDVTLWGRRAVGQDTATPDAEWGLINDKRGVIKLGKLATALAVGTHHYHVEDLGSFGMIAAQKSANTVVMSIQPIHHGL
jgi:hypothetical protein